MCIPTCHFFFSCAGTTLLRLVPHPWIVQVLEAGLLRPVRLSEVVSRRYNPIQSKDRWLTSPPPHTHLS